MDDGAKLCVRQWPDTGNSPDAKKIRGAVHIIHGMAEHAGRYERLAQKLCAEGFIVWAADQRGHGRTADASQNDPGKGGLLGYCGDADGFSRVTADIDIINRRIRKAYPDVPLFLMGHSWGSFIAQNYIETYGGCFPGVSDPVRLAGCILSGTRGPAGVQAVLAQPVMSFIALVKGSRKGSKLARFLADGSYNNPFKPNRTPFDWLSRDNAEVDAYNNDPLCGFLCSSGFYRDLVNGLKRISRNEAFLRIRTDLPVYVFSGNQDPVGEMGESTTALVNIYRKTGISDLEFVLYPDARHEPLNETNRDEVTGNLLNWLLKHTIEKN